jgi:hypothetical protein
MEKNESKLDEQIANANNAAILIIVVSVLLLCIVVANLFLSCPKEKYSKEIQISYHLNSSNLKDSTCKDYYKVIDENNNKLLKEINSSLNKEYSRIQAIIDSKEEQNIYNSYCAGIIALIIGVAGFFGFKSINEMKKDAIESSERESKKIAEKTANEVTKSQNLSYLNKIQEDILNIVKVYIETEFKSQQLKINDDTLKTIYEKFEPDLQNIMEQYFQLKSKIEDCCDKTVANNKTNDELTLINNVNNIEIEEDNLFSDNDL